MSKLTKGPRRKHKTVVAVRTTIGALTAIMLTAMAARLEAHHWYPERCCHDRDCYRIDDMRRLADGSVWVSAGLIDVIIPPGFTREASLDHDAHVCVYYDLDFQAYRPSCLFIPAEA